MTPEEIELIMADHRKKMDEAMLAVENALEIIKACRSEMRDDAIKILSKRAEELRRGL